MDKNKNSLINGLVTLLFYLTKQTLRIILWIITLYLLIQASIFFASKHKEKKIAVPKRNCVLYIKMQGELVNNKSFFLDRTQKEIEIDQLLKIIKEATYDERIVGLCMNFKGFYGGFADLLEVRHALEQFHLNNKFITSYSNGYHKGEYLLASISDEIITTPASGGIDCSGWNIGNLFFKKFFDKIGIDIEVFRVGEYKSAVEPFTSDRMSKESKQAEQEFIDYYKKIYLEYISKGRNIPTETINEDIENLSFRDIKFLKESNYITSLNNFNKKKYIKSLTKNQEDGEKIEYNIVRVQDFYRDIYNKNKKNKNYQQIAVLPLVGEIKDGNDSKTINVKRLEMNLKKILRDNKIKAVVLKIDSPGGSFLESEILHSIIKDFSTEKPIVAYISNIGASGGYYIAAACKNIISSPVALTGSIGIFNLFPKCKKLVNDLGITYDSVKTNSSADIDSAFHLFSDFEKKAIQKNIENGYDLFLTRVAEGRNKTKDEINKVARGRVWTGKMAYNIGLVDEMGFLDTAIKKAAELAKINTYDVCYHKLYESGFFFNEIHDFVGNSSNYQINSLLKKVIGTLDKYGIIFNQTTKQNAQLLAYCPIEKTIL